MFNFSTQSLTILENQLNNFHKLFKHNKCSSTYIEELIYNGLNADPNYHGLVKWKCNSHNPKEDILIETSKPIYISVKSGTIYNNTVTISGHRLGKHACDLESINTILKEYTCDVLTCFLYEEYNKNYKILYIDKDVFTYPILHTDWQQNMKKKENKISDYRYLSHNNVLTKIIPDMSWQVWWYIPIELCRFERSITINSI